MDIINGLPGVPGSSETPSIKKEVKRKEKSFVNVDHKTAFDKVSISKDAISALQGKGYVNMVYQLPEVRKELVEKAKNDIANGNLLSNDNIEKTAEILLRNLSEDII